MRNARRPADQSDNDRQPVDLVAGVQVLNKQRGKSFAARSSLYFPFVICDLKLIIAGNHSMFIGR
jgi:hypothetical protein